MKMSKIVAFVMAMVLAVGCLTGCGADKGYTSENTEIKIGLSGPLTGDAAVYGVAVKNSAQMAIDEINAAGGLNGVMFKFIATDDQHDATKVAANYANMLESGMAASIWVAPVLTSWPWITPRRELISPITSPIYSSGTITEVFIMGSMSTGAAFLIASLNAIEAAILIAISEESTS